MFDFLQAPPVARLAALGGVNVSLADRDPGLSAANPALNGDSLQGAASVSYQFHVAAIGHAFFSYAHHFKRAGVIHFGVQHMQYGEIQGYDASGAETALFNAGETALMIAKNHRVGNFRLGASVKGVFSNIAGHRVSAVLADLGGVFIHPDQQLTVGLAVKHVGFAFGAYRIPGDELPFDVQAGATLKPQHMPLRFSFTVFNLSRPDVTYFDPAQETGMAKILSHINFGTEILLHKNVNLLAGYNYLMHRSLRLERGGAGAGITLGFSAAVRSFEFVFSRSAYVAGNAGYGFTCSADLNKIVKRLQ